MSRHLRRKLATLFPGNVSLITGPHLSPADRTAFVQSIPDPGDNHTLVVGGTRKGKSGLLILSAQDSLARGQGGITALDPQGSFVREVRDWCANPANGQHERRVHFLGSSSSSTFGLNPLANDGSWEGCHDAAVTLASVIESRFEASPEQTPRLARIVYVAAMLCARHGLTLLEMLELLSIGGEDLRRSLLKDFENRIVAKELEDLHTLATRHQREFLALVESTKNRFVRWLGDRRLARILGQRRGLDPLAIVDGCEVVLADFSSYTYADAAFLGCLINSMYFAAARRRPPLQGPRHRLILDEAESLITLDVARMCDQSAKHGLLLTAAIQRLGQLRARGDFIADALLTNCGVKICFGGLEPTSARYMAEAVYSGHIDHAEWKPGTERPVAVGNERLTLRSRSHASHHAEHVSSSRADIRTQARASAFTTANMVASAATSATSGNTSFASTPDTFPLHASTPLSQATGFSRSQSAARTSARSSSRSSALQSARGRADAVARGTSMATSVSEGESEAYVTRYEVLPTQTYSLEEQLHRLAGTLMNLPRRQCIVKLEDQEPFRTRTPDLPPAFRCVEFRSQMLPLYIDKVNRESRYLVPIDEVDAEIAARLAGITQPPEDEHDFAKPEPAPIVSDPDTFARNFWQRRTPQSPGRPPVGDLDDKHERFRVVDGGKPDGDKQP